MTAEQSSGLFLPWDTDLFGVRIGRVAGERLTEPLAAEIDRWAERERLACLYFLADPSDARTVRIAEARSYRLVDERVTLARSLPAGLVPDESTWGVRPATLADSDSLKAIARLAHTDSRFFADGRFPRERAADLYATWIEKSLKGDAAIVFTAEMNGRSAGYVSCHWDSAEEGRIGLVGVAAEARGMGLATALLRAALDWFEKAGVRRVSVVTQGRNAGALRLYTRCGFSIVSIRHWYHRWPDRAAPTYAPLFFRRLVEVEDRHFWFVARNRLLRSLVSRLLESVPGRARILEVGCGNGNVLRTLGTLGRPALVVGMDLFVEGLHLARRRVSSPLVLAHVEKRPFSRPFDLVGCFDVLEHLENDEEILWSLRAALPPAGALVLTVPAHPWLWSDFDTASHHRRRYEEGELRAKLLRAGFDVEFLSPFMTLLLPLALLVRRLRPQVSSRDGLDLEMVYRRASRDLRVVPILNGLLKAALALEAAWIGARRRLPFGTSFVAVARRRERYLTTAIGR